MNLYFRLFWMFLTTPFKSKIGIFDELISNHRVLLNDLDLLFHMNNGRYFTITDYVRYEHSIRCGFAKELKKRGMTPVVAGETAQFRKPLRLFQKYQIKVKLVGWDDKFFYMEQKFESNKRLHALILVRARVLTKKGQPTPSPLEMIRYNNPEISEIKMNKIIEQWNYSSKAHWEALTKSQ